MTEERKFLSNVPLSKQEKPNANNVSKLIGKKNNRQSLSGDNLPKPSSYNTWNFILNLQGNTQYTRRNPERNLRIIVVPPETAALVPV